MKFISKLALAAALTAGMATTVAVAPAAAQKKGKDKDVKDGGLKLADAVRKPVAAAQTALAAKDYPTALAQLAIAEPFATTDDEKYIVAAMKLQAIAPENNLQKLAPILDVLIVNPKTPPQAVAQYNFFRAQTALQQKKYAEALPYLTKAKELGFKDPNLQLNIASATIETGNLAGGLAAIDTAITEETAAGKKAPEDWYNYAIARVYGKDPAATAAWSQKKLSAYPTAKNWRESLLLYRDGREKSTQKLDRGQQIDLFRLMRATKSLADRGDYLEYADTAYIAGLPGEAKAVIDEGRATAKIPASDPTSSKLLADVNTSLKAEALTASEAKAKAGANGRIALQTGDAYLGLGQNAKAIELYQLALQKGGVDVSEANLHLGVAYSQAGQKDQAKAAFQTITAAGARKDIASYWLKYLDSGISTTAPSAPPPPAPVG